MAKKTDPTTRLLKEIMDSAEAHGLESEPDHEAGDLKNALVVAWAVMTPEQRRQVHKAHFEDHERWGR